MSAVNLALDHERRTRVPNQFPTSTHELPYRIAIIGEAPGADEEMLKIPFVGKSGQLLDKLLSNAQILRGGCFVGNVCQIRPPQNEISRFAWGGPEIQSGLQQLKADLDAYNPNICILLGATPLTSAMGTRKSISDWRGSLFVSENRDSPFYSRKCIAAYHPAYVVRTMGTDMYLTVLDLKRARREGETSTLALPHRDIFIDLTPEQIIQRLESWPSGVECSIDIEGVLKNWSCVSVASSPSEVFIIDWYSMSLEDETRVMIAFSRLLWRHDVPKTLQNGLYDNFVMAFGYRILAHNVWDDTMLKGWEIYPELPKGLGDQASIWTRQPNWKDELMAYSAKKQKALAAAGVDTRRNKLRGCCIDSAVTSEISRAQEHVLQNKPLARQHYRFNMELNRPLLYMELHGINYDIAGAKQLRDETVVELNEAKARLAARTRNADLYGKKGSFSTKKLCTLLYDTLKLPKQYRKEHGRNTDSLTTDTESLLQLIRKTNNQTLHEILYIKKRLKLKQYLEIDTDPDGRVRCGYNLVGTETGRMSCYESPTGSGTNLTTITKSLRRLYRADEGFDFAQFDLSGADGWTVALHCNRLGDSTMLDDYLYGIKPAQVIAVMYTIFQQEMAKVQQRTGTIQAEIMNRLFKYFREIPREQLKALCKQVDSEGWLYFGCKRVQHGKNYLLGKDTMSSQIIKDSYKFLGEAIYVAPSDCELLGQLYIGRTDSQGNVIIRSRYSAASLWQGWVKNELLTKKALTGASGHTRTFFGRIKERGEICHATLREAVADEPQENTTYATNLAIHRLWTDPDNRIEINGRTHLIIQPLHQVHDAACVQWPKTRREWAMQKSRTYFNNEITIAEQKIIIGVEGAYGPNWSGHHFNCPKQKSSKNECTCGDDHGKV